MSSILLRRRRNHNPHNDTSLQTQWDKDQAKMDARRANMAKRNAGILGRLQGDSKQKQYEREQASSEMKAYMERVKIEATRQKERDVKEAQALAQVENELIAKQEAKVIAKKQWSHEMMMQNRKLCEFRYEQRQSKAQQDRQEDASRVANGFMNRFGTSLQ